MQHLKNVLETFEGLQICVCRGRANDDLLAGMNADFNRSTYVVTERDDDEDDDEV